MRQVLGGAVQTGASSNTMVSVPMLDNTRRDARSLLDGASNLVGAIEAALRSLEGGLRADFEAIRADWREVSRDMRASAFWIERHPDAQQQGRLFDLDAMDRGNGERTAAP